MFQPYMIAAHPPLTQLTSQTKHHWGRNATVSKQKYNLKQYVSLADIQEEGLHPAGRPPNKAVND